MLNSRFVPEKMILFSKGIIFPALIMCCFFVCFFSISNFSDKTYHIVHNTFLIITALTFFISYYFRVSSITIISSIIYISYLVINSLRYTYGEDYIFSAGYNIWSIILLPTILFAFYFFCKSSVSKYWSWFYVFLFIETMIIENTQNQVLNPDSYYFYKHISMLNYPAFTVSIICIITFLMRYIIKGKVLNGAIFLTSIGIFMSVYLSDNLFAFSLFSLASSSVLLVSLALHLYYNSIGSEDLGVANFYSFCRDADKKFPLKYSISLLYIDEYERLVKRFGKDKMLILKKMFFNRIKNINPDILLYNYKSDSLIMVFVNENASESFNKADEIRRSLVKSIFIFNENNHLQLTASQCISEKRRSDASSITAITRAENALKNACKFTRNITIKA